MTRSRITLVEGCAIAQSDTKHRWHISPRDARFSETDWALVERFVWEGWSREETDLHIAHEVQVPGASVLHSIKS